MALATKCPHCNTIFRVAADQLKLRGGIVRCGSCKEVFDGNAALVDPAAPAAVRAPAAVAPPVPVPVSPPPAPVAEPAAAPISVPVPPTPAEADFSLNFDTSLDPFGLLPDTAAEDDTVPAPEAAPDVKPVPEPAPVSPPLAAPPASPAPTTSDIPASPPAAQTLDLELDLDLDFDIEVVGLKTATATPAPEPAEAPPPESPAAEQPMHDGRREPSFDVEPEEHIVAAALPSDDGPHDADATITPAHRPPVDATTDDTGLSATDGEGSVPADDTREDALDDTSGDATEEPGFVRQGRRRERLGRAMRIIMAIGSALLLATLLAQGLTTFRNQLAANVPQVKPLLVSACSVFGCRVDVPAQIDALSIEQGELQTLAENTFSYASILHNQSASAQAWPSIELTLNDAADKPVLRRVLSPRDYLAPTVDLSKGFAPHSEQAVKLYFELAQLKASGYHIAIFYP
jgi:predicted Zn finger-like uncharacterized protein